MNITTTTTSILSTWQNKKKSNSISRCSLRHTLLSATINNNLAWRSFSKGDCTPINFCRDRRARAWVEFSSGRLWLQCQWPQIFFLKVTLLNTSVFISLFHKLSIPSRDKSNLFLEALQFCQTTNGTESWQRCFVESSKKTSAKYFLEYISVASRFDPWWLSVTSVKNRQKLQQPEKTPVRWNVVDDPHPDKARAPNLHTMAFVGSRITTLKFWSGWLDLWVSNQNFGRIGYRPQTGSFVRGSVDFWTQFLRLCCRAEWGDVQ